MPYIFIDSLVVRDGHAQLGREVSHYIASVLRHRVADELELFDADGRYYRATITALGRGGVTVRAVQEAAPQRESSLDMVLCQGLLKGDKMDLVVEKSTELGVRRIIPVSTQRGQMHHTRRLQRWKKIAIEAARQSGRVVVPDVAEVTDLSSLLGQISSEKDAPGIMFYEGEGTHTPRDLPGTPGRVYVLVGSEGGFTTDEVLHAQGAGVLIASLGRRILRAETAAIVGVALVQFLYGDLGLRR
ncbi:MAG: 16S rRNA (uracil(1498)-N(3))-methyltransferase [Candidatus Magnetobacterium sp. LHC-1]|uniref:Ribosomal RNA small subunit methyltransferase E n=1 Tax=Candidatus Magnetobacterium casense TaxID=1455061 RepID=A0ABS6S1N9_9BACT|nr:16S rRNA (uracil(1498)-N(3))-methyltransferase [Candidatus Magnetobacterium casensis]MBF0607388.1 16S rRNA (uracil(1498)-N(3))-methyltransferase [Nitrospirota bacterium]MBV6342766.1 16S rRNA (uracil(1498)-N(3))-methyltransferase [Candidatus Magnetobacterium casensis]